MPQPLAQNYLLATNAIPPLCGIISTVVVLRIPARCVAAIAHAAAVVPSISPPFHIRYRCFLLRYCDFLLRLLLQGIHHDRLVAQRCPRKEKRNSMALR